VKKRHGQQSSSSLAECGFGEWSRLYGAAELGPIVLKEWVDARVDIDLHHPALLGWKLPSIEANKQQRVAVGARVREC
jgi:hypothetical protein